ncbi:hypothetical protein MNV49_006396 [Pseudohyphozyma bogoriensis]|nr:hypothetical protein MNV49_006396 [Pseudohyphozyma bogoriensis]
MRGPACVMMEAVHVVPEGRVSPECLGLWSDEQMEAFKPIVEVIKAQGSIPGIQLAHAGRKSSNLVPWLKNPLSKPGVKAGSENRLRLPLEIIALTRNLLPPTLALFVRISATDWYSDGEKNEDGEWISWGPEQSEVFLKEAIEVGADLLDVSTGGGYVKQSVKSNPGYQVPFAERLRKALPTKDSVAVAT